MPATRLKDRGLALRAASLLVYLYLYAPIVVLIVFSFNSSQVNAVWQGATLRWYRAAWNDAAIIHSLRNSLIVAFAATSISTIIGTLAAIALARYRFRLRQAASMLFYLPIILPEIVIAFSTVAFFGLIGFKLGMATVIVAHVAFSLPYVVFVVRARLSGMSKELEEAAMDLGANELQAFLSVTLPLLAPAIISAALLVFTISLDDYLITSFVAGKGATTLPLVIYSMVKTGVTPAINAVSSVLLVATILLVYLSQRIQRGAPSKPVLASASAVILGLAIFAIGGAGKAYQQKQLNLYIWSNYVNDKLIKRFEERYNVRVNIEYYSSNEALLAKLQTGVVDYDLVMPSDYMIATFIKDGLLQPIDKSRLKNFDNLDPRFLNQSFDPNNEYSIPFAWGTSGIGYRKDKVKEEIKSWAAFWDPRFSGRISLLDDIRENFAVALKLKGYSLNSTDPQQIAEARDLLLRQKPLVQTYDSATFDQLLLSGDAWIVQGYSGQIARASQENPNIVYVIPQEGCTIWSDNLCIPRTASSPDLALLFIDYILEAESAAEVTNFSGFSSPNLAARPLIKPEILNNPAIFPPRELLDRCEFISSANPALPLYERYWTEIKSR